MLKRFKDRVDLPLKDPPMPWKDISHDSTKDIVNIGAWRDTKGILISDGISLYVPIKTATLFEHYTHSEEPTGDEACPEQSEGIHEILHGVYPEPKIETLRFTQGDKWRRVQNDKNDTI